MKESAISWPLEPLQDDQRVRLDELPAANAPLAMVYLLKTELKEI